MDLKWRHFSISSHFIQQDLYPFRLVLLVTNWIWENSIPVLKLVIHDFFIHRPDIVTPRCLKSLRGSKWNPNWRLEKSLVRWWDGKIPWSRCVSQKMGSQKTTQAVFDGQNEWKNELRWIWGYRKKYQTKSRFLWDRKNLKHRLICCVLLGFSSIPGSSLRNKPPSCVLLS